MVLDRILYSVYSWATSIIKHVQFNVATSDPAVMPCTCKKLKIVPLCAVQKFIHQNIVMVHLHNFLCAYDSDLQSSTVTVLMTR